MKHTNPYTNWKLGRLLREIHQYEEYVEKNPNPAGNARRLDQMYEALDLLHDRFSDLEKLHSKELEKRV